MMVKRVLSGVAPGLLLAVLTAPGWAQVAEKFDGAYKDGLFDGWKTDREFWGEKPTPAETKPGRGDSGSAQSLATKSGCHYAYKTFSGLKPGETYEVSVWVRAGFAAEGARGFPGGMSWVEFGWDPKGRDRAKNAVDVWCVDPKYDYDNNMGKWAKYTGEPFKAEAEKVTVVFKAGTVDKERGFRADFDDLTIAKSAAKPKLYTFPDKFDGEYRFGLAEGWKRRFIHGGVTPLWEKAEGRSGSAFRLYATDDNANKAVNIGAVKLFKVEPKQTYKISIWISAASTAGTPLADKDPRDIGPIIRFGVDPTGQDLQPLASSIVWSFEPKGHFSMMGNQNKWKEFQTPPFETKGDTVAVWLWVMGDYATGVSAAFDDLDLVKVEK